MAGTGAGAPGADGTGGAAGGDTEAGAGEWPEGMGSGTANRAGGSGAEDAFERSLGDYDQVIGAEQEAIARAGGGQAADEVFRDAGAVGGAAGEPGVEPEGSGTYGDQDGAAGEAGSDASGGAPERAAPVVQGCEDADRVARQLCEAATNEQDPFLRAALWDEYNEYKRILARQ